MVIIKNILTKRGHKIVEYDVIKDETDAIRQKVGSLLSSDIDIIVTNGGTGIAKRDVTFEAVSGLLKKEIPGFGELFRYLSYKEIGASAILSRALAGVAGDKILICLPGSKNAVKLGVNFIADELGHLVWEAGK